MSDQCEECNDAYKVNCPLCESYGDIPCRCECGNPHFKICPQCNGHKYFNCGTCAPSAMRGAAFGQDVN
jgi:hypothetical protein